MVDPKEHWAQKAEELKNSGKFEEAIKMLDKAQEVKREEKEDDFWYKKAIHSCEIGEYEQAKDALVKNFEINQKSYDSFFLMGKIFYKLKRYEESLEYLNKSSEEYNRQHLRNTSKIDQMKNVNKFEEAVKYSDLVYQEKEIDPEYWYQKGLVLIKLGKFNESSSCFETILEKNQTNPKFLYGFAKSELGAGNKQKSLEILEKTCKIDSTFKAKLKIDKDFDQITQEKQFKMIVGL